MGKPYFFHTTCVSSTYELITSMQERSREVTYRTMLKHCHGLLSVAHTLGYDRSKTQGLTLKHDWSVSYHKSIYNGMPCYYFVWSHIEHIWIKER